jgi:hypothetical protein
LVALGQPEEAAHLLALARQIMQAYLAKNSDPLCRKCIYPNLIIGSYGPQTWQYQMVAMIEPKKNFYHRKTMIILSTLITLPAAILPVASPIVAQ